jgi:Fe-S-cluster containining protein
MNCERLLAGLGDHTHKKEFIVWFNIFANPILSAQPQEIRIKRNRYLYLMVVSLMNNDIAGFLKLVKKAHETKPTKCRMTPTMQSEKTTDEQNRPKSTLHAVCPTTFDYPERPVPEWQLEKRWDSVIAAVRATNKKLQEEKDSGRPEALSQKLEYKICSFHLDAPGCPMKNITINLDEQPKTVHGRVEKVRVNCFF